MSADTSPPTVYLAFPPQPEPGARRPRLQAIIDAVDAAGAKPVISSTRTPLPLVDFLDTAAETFLADQRAAVRASTIVALVDDLDGPVADTAAELVFMLTADGPHPPILLLADTDHPCSVPPVLQAILAPDLDNNPSDLSLMLTSETGTDDLPDAARTVAFFLGTILQEPAAPASNC